MYNDTYNITLDSNDVQLACRLTLESYLETVQIASWLTLESSFETVQTIESLKKNLLQKTDAVIIQLNFSNMIIK